MRKISSKEEERKKEKKKQRIIGILLVVVMMGSLFGIIVDSFNFSEESKKAVNYAGLEFNFDGNYYNLQIGEVSFYFSESPETYAPFFYKVNITKNLASIIGQPLYVESSDYTFSKEIAQNFQGYPERIQLACLNDTDCFDETLPIKTCEDNLIVIRESSIDKVYEKDNCIFIEGKKDNLLKLTDITILKMLGVQ